MYWYRNIEDRQSDNAIRPHGARFPFRIKLNSKQAYHRLRGENHYVLGVDPYLEVTIHPDMFVQIKSNPAFTAFNIFKVQEGHDSWGQHAHYHAEIGFRSEREAMLFKLIF